ncbi:hypothetical protein [Amazonocrinis nigriterrae]|uniref:hypothetical protein n=1 Tax=Amazonocrinis nigriterrae TaxID=2840443 RepID=UPI001BE4A765|nr:hypothetical protein [Amazonocrinis nigriterrae]
MQADEQLNQIEKVLAFFATFVLDSALVQQIMRWDMTVLRSSPWYEEIFQSGQREDRLSSIELTLEVKFGDEGLNLMPKISQISDIEELKTIQRSILSSETVEEVKRILEN